VRPGVPLKQLRLQGCVLHDSAEGLAVALALLPDLQHLSISPAQRVSSFGFPIKALLGLQQLTYLELAGIVVRNPDNEGPALQPLQALTRLVDLRLHIKHQQAAVYSSMVSASQHLTRLELTGQVVLAHGVLATLTQLQHLRVTLFNRADRTLRDQQGLHQRTWQQLQGQLSQLQALQQLTHLAVRCDSRREGNPPAAAFSALTASSKLQHLDISKCRLPSDAWQHVFPTGRQLPELQYLDISDVQTLPRGPAAAPEATRLVSCCPGLQCLDMRNLQYSAEFLAPLQGLSGLHTLRLGSRIQEEGGPPPVEAVAQLTGLRELTLSSPRSGGGLLQLTQLQQLTLLEFEFAGTVVRTFSCLTQQVGSLRIGLHVSTCKPGAAFVKVCMRMLLLLCSHVLSLCWTLRKCQTAPAWQLRQS
jgi:hypothetical protein